ncbi:globin domain-containing protein [Nocardia seriolae]|uniref:nitric oxide dioxygenase n=1 Tax=Nocardia seriolae TaxID=37332 RepID=A0ABC8B0K6_9NOCA|nr:globin domain-containing protein [Nocardia seriolae]APA99770.1 Nitric oxide dioxygenase [Nocardia seriolae]OJF81349.1 hemin transporter [Nocardia seriolae]PSK27576.1 hemin transporter [Nocardia seriolae]QOW34653.1 hemin transporter [Nocardia seriolae]QUN17881.1 hemin transporter [Nocardia seriolae]
MRLAPDSSLNAVPELEPEHAEVIRATLPLVAAHIDQITPLFYKKMFTAHPELLRDRFNRGNQKQGGQQRALAASIATFATHLVDPSLPHPRDLLARIGHKHVSLAVTEPEYRIVHEHLFAAIVEVLGADVVTPAIAAAWDRVYWLMATTLIDFERELYDAAGVEPGDVFRQTRVVERIDDPSGVATFVVAAADPARPLPGFEPGQYISVGARLPDGARQLRQYSLVNRGGDGRLAFTVRRVPAEAEAPAGEVSNWLHDHLQVGDALEITLPFGDLTIDTDATTPLVLISAGIGVTPMVGILEYLAAETPSRRTVVLHADRSTAAYPLRETVADLATRLHDVYLRAWYQADGHGLMDLTGVEFPDDADFYLCGGTGFLQHIRAQLMSAGIPSNRVHFELFAPNDWLLDAEQSPVPA